MDDGCEQIDHAIDDITGGMSTRQAANKWQVPRTTLQNHKKGGHKAVVRPGPSTVSLLETVNLGHDVYSVVFLLPLYIRILIIFCVYFLYVFLCLYIARGLSFH